MTKHPDLTPMTSSVFSGAHYDPDSRALTVRYATGDTWRYADVPAERAHAFAGAASPGRYFAAKIRGQYTGRKL